MEKYLQYQQVDGRLIKIESEIKNSDCFKEYSKAKATIKGASDRLAKVESDATELVSTLGKMKANLAKVAEELSELVAAVEDVDDIKEIDYYTTNIDKLSAKADALEKDVNRTIKEIDEKVKEFNMLMNAGKNATKAQKELGEKVQALKDEKKPEFDAIRAELAQLEKDLDPVLIAKYKNLRGVKKPPYFVPLSGENCTGCGMELAYDTLSKLKKEGDWTECPHCQKILYK